jgi:hypothetical protein
MKFKNKNGISLGESVGAVLTLMLIAILVIISIFLFSSLSVTVPDRAQTKINETGYINGSAHNPYYLGNSSDCGFGSPSITRIINASDGLVITSPNYTVSSTGILTNLTSKNWVRVNITYTFTDKGEACIASRNMITNFSQYPALVGLVGTIIFLGIVIGVLVASFTFGKQRA